MSSFLQDIYLESHNFLHKFCKLFHVKQFASKHSEIRKSVSRETFESVNNMMQSVSRETFSESGAALMYTVDVVL